MLTLGGSRITVKPARSRHQGRAPHGLRGTPSSGRPPSCWTSGEPDPWWPRARSCGATSERLRLLNEVHQALGRPITQAELFELILDRAFAHLRPQEGAIYLRAGDGSFACVTSRSTQGPGHAPFYSTNLVREVAEKGLAALVLDVAADERFAGAASILGAGVRSLVAAPLLDPEGSLGMIVLGSAARTRCFSPDDMELLVSLASAAALRIRNVALAEEAAERRRLALGDGPGAPHPGGPASRRRSRRWRGGSCTPSTARRGWSPGTCTRRCCGVRRRSWRSWSPTWPARVSPRPCSPPPWRPCAPVPSRPASRPTTSSTGSRRGCTAAPHRRSTPPRFWAPSTRPRRQAAVRQRRAPAGAGPGVRRLLSVARTHRPAARPAARRHLPAKPR